MTIEECREQLINGVLQDAKHTLQEFIEKYRDLEINSFDDIDELHSALMKFRWCVDHIRHRANCINKIVINEPEDPKSNLFYF